MINLIKEFLNWKKEKENKKDAMETFVSLHSNEIKELEKSLSNLYPSVSEIINKQLDSKIGCLKINVQVPIYYPFENKENKNEQLLLEEHKETVLYVESIAIGKEMLYHIGNDNSLKREEDFIKKFFPPPKPGMGYKVSSLKRHELFDGTLFTVNVIKLDDEYTEGFLYDGDNNVDFRQNNLRNIPKGIILHDHYRGNVQKVAAEMYMKNNLKLGRWNHFG